MYLYKDHSPHGRVLVVQSLRYVKNKMITNEIRNLSLTWGNFFMPYILYKAGWSLHSKRCLPPARHLSHFVTTKIWFINDPTK